VEEDSDNAALVVDTNDDYPLPPPSPIASVLTPLETTSPFSTVPPISATPPVTPEPSHVLTPPITPNADAESQFAGSPPLTTVIVSHTLATPITTTPSVTAPDDEIITSPVASPPLLSAVVDSPLLEAITPPAVHTPLPAVSTPTHSEIHLPTSLPETTNLLPLGASPAPEAVLPAPLLTVATAPEAEVVDIDLTDPDVAKAAVFIQAGFKGLKLRKRTSAAAAVASSKPVTYGLSAEGTSSPAPAEAVELPMTSEVTTDQTSDECDLV